MQLLKLLLPPMIMMIIHYSLKFHLPNLKARMKALPKEKKKPKNKINKYSIYYIAAAIVFLECILCLYITEM